MISNWFLNVYHDHRCILLNAEVWPLAGIISLGNTLSSGVTGLGAVSTCEALDTGGQSAFHSRCSNYICRTRCSHGGGGMWIPGWGLESSRLVPEGTWRRCSSPRRWQKGRDVLRVSWQTVSQWLWGFGERVTGSREVRVWEREREGTGY